MSQKIHHRVSLEQLEELWEALFVHRELTTGYNKSAQARLTSSRLWAQIANKLNSYGNGAEKDGRGWAKYWNDYKCRLKKLASSQLSSLRGTGGGPPSDRTMSDIEKKFLQLLGSGFGSGLPGVRVDPFDGETPAQSSHGPGSIHLDTSFYGMNEPGPSWRSSFSGSAPPPSPHFSVTPSVTNSPPASLSHDRPSRRQREVPLTATAARRQLIGLSERNTATGERVATALERMIEEMKKTNDKLDMLLAKLG